MQRDYQHWAGLTGQKLSSAVMQQLLQSLALCCYLGHVLAHTRAGLHRSHNEASNKEKSAHHHGCYSVESEQTVQCLVSMTEHKWKITGMR